MYCSLLQLFASTFSTRRVLPVGFVTFVVALGVGFVSASKVNAQNINNTFYGEGAGTSITTGGIQNTGIGINALHFNTTGDNNTASGADALSYNETGNANTANGSQALIFNIGGGGNTANGYQTLVRNRSGSFNTASGYQALYLNQTGGQNTANGVQALYRTTGGGNIGLGFQAGVNLTTGSNNIDIGNAGVAGESGKIRIGKQGTHNGTFIAGISGVAVTGPHVVVSANGKLGVAASSTRFKKAIKPMDKASEAIHQLEPVTFRYKEEVDPNSMPQFGLIAEEVEKVNPELVVRDDEGKAYTVRYEAVNAMLLNEFLKEHRNVAEQQSTIAELKTMVAQQQKQIETLAAGLQKVSAAVELNKPAPTQVADNR
jgi:trimeric autotransporter adhesin